MAGISDIRIAKEMKKRFRAFNGRRIALERAFAGQEDLAGVLERNTYHMVSRVPGEVLEKLLRYVKKQRTALKNQDAADVYAGKVRFV